MWEVPKLAYLAGIIDGEGCICIRHHTKDRKSPTWDSRLYIVSTDRKLIDWLQSNFGGLTYSRNSKKNPHWKTKHEWVVPANQLLPILYAVLPYLVIKKEHSEIAIKFRKTYPDRNYCKIPKEFTKIRLECFQSLKKLNHRGSN